MIGKVIIGLRMTLILLCWVVAFKLFNSDVMSAFYDRPGEIRAKFVRPDVPEGREFTPPSRCANAGPFDPLQLDAGRPNQPSADDNLAALQERAEYDRSELANRPQGFSPDDVARETSRRALAFRTDIGRDMNDQHPSGQVRAGNSNDPIYRLERDCPEGE